MSERRGDDQRSTALERIMAALYAKAREAWPGVELTGEQFRAHLIARCPHGASEPALVGLRASDLYLACACAAGDNIAIRRFEEAFAGDIRATLRGLRCQDSDIDEVMQLVREKLFIAREGRPPKIAAYAGRGDLRSFVCVTASRLALNFKRDHGRERPIGQDLLAALPAIETDAELAHLKARYQPEVRAAFGDAVAALEPRDRNLLRHHYLDQLNIGQLAAIYHVHRVTASRWLQEAHAALIDAIKTALGSRTNIEPEHLASLLHVLRSQLQVSLHSVFAVSASR